MLTSIKKILKFFQYRFFIFIALVFLLFSLFSKKYTLTFLFLVIAMTFFIYKEKFLKLIFKNFLSSFKIDARYLIVAILEVGFFVLIFLTLLLAGSIVQAAAKKIIDFKLTPEGLVAEGLEANLALIRNFLFYIFGAIVLVLFLFWLISSIFKATIFATILKRKISFGFIKNFAIANLFWFLLWGIILLIFIFAFIGAASVAPILGISILIIFYILYFHFGTIFYLSLILKEKFIQALSFAFSNGSKIRFWILPYAYILIITFIIFQIPSIFISLNLKLASIIAALLILFFRIWYYFFIYTNIKPDLKALIKAK